MFYRLSYQLRLQIEKISVRERYLAILTLAALILFLTYGALMLIGLTNNDNIQARIADRTKEIARTGQVALAYQDDENNF